MKHHQPTPSTSTETNHQLCRITLPDHHTLSAIAAGRIAKSSARRLESLATHAPTRFPHEHPCRKQTAGLAEANPSGYRQDGEDNHAPARMQTQSGDFWFSSTKYHPSDTPNRHPISPGSRRPATCQIRTIPATGLARAARLGYGVRAHTCMQPWPLTRKSAGISVRRDAFLRTTPLNQHRTPQVASSHPATDW